VPVLNKYIKAYEKKEKANEALNAIKKEAIKYVLENGNKLEYKKWQYSYHNLYPKNHHYLLTTNFGKPPPYSLYILHL